MLLRELKLHSFKNYREVKVSFADGAICIIGKNGMGKTNLLDAIFTVAMTKSAHNLTDQQLIRHDDPYFAINSLFEREGAAHKVNMYCERGRRKQLKVDEVEVTRMSDHIGLIPCVITSPDDSGIIQEGSEGRRRLFDMVIAQCDQNHLKNLIEYQKLLKQRNSLLKSVEHLTASDTALLDVYDERILPINTSIALRRKMFAEEFIPFFQENYRSIFPGPEEVRIQYESESLSPTFNERFVLNRKKDLILQRTEMGNHKDDFYFEMNGQPIKKFGSQGQQKSFIIALKLAEYDFLKERKGFNPILLLDDIFDKLDDERIAHLVNLLSDPARFSQFFITDARSERSKVFFQEKNQVTFLEVENGTIK